MAKKKTTVLDFDNDPEIVEEEENTPIENNSASNSNNDIKNASNSDSILSSVLSKTTKEPKKIYTGFYLDEPVKKTIDKIVKQNKDTNKSKLVNDLLTEAFKQAGLMK
ncbi:hypothetical protein CN895_23035 [Bacillus cereus]|uniref:hypothetical protein n=1 Tax=Bacillus cereus TaxID=1396 RepID=UPI000BFDBF39|nr:hypothetical protein [Bacillus cereus]PGK10527.1 hypothetical protein CN895_23035 [Bacillus cereus]